jgi:hypothetical protein
MLLGLLLLLLLLLVLSGGRRVAEGVVSFHLFYMVLIRT